MKSRVDRYHPVTPPHPSSDAFLKIVGRFMSVKAAEDYLILSVSPKHGYDV